MKVSRVLSVWYHVRVALLHGYIIIKTVLVSFSVPTGGLTPPSFTLWATASSLTVRVHEKPILRKLFPYGLIYTIYLEERGQDKKVGIKIGTIQEIM